MGRGKQEEKQRQTVWGFGEAWMRPRAGRLYNTTLLVWKCVEDGPMGGRHAYRCC